MKWLRSLLSLCALCAGIAIVTAPAGAQPVQQYFRGRIAPKNLHELKRASALRHNLTATALPPATEKEWDSRKLGIIGPVFNQGRCGSCWCCAGVRAIQVAAAKAGVAKADDFKLSEQYVLDCVNSGGCNGDDHSTVFSHAQKFGLPFTKDYGPYKASEGRCHSNDSMLRFKITDWGYCDPDANGPAGTQKIKDCIKAYGAVSVAVAAGNDWPPYSGGIHVGSNRGIDHEVDLVGWKDDPSVRSGGYWLLSNSWGPDWGENGYMRIAYGSDSVSTDAAFVIVDNPNPPPSPVPPVPPGPPSPIHNVGAYVAGLLTGLLIGACVLVVFATRRKS